ncbi:MAG: phosphate butyryltransferase, partial [Pseudothermotoga sp.]|nr:phosphate butyryltransferase [Pseudothermotoga sp.]
MRSLGELIQMAKRAGKKNLVVVGAEDEEAVEAALMAKTEGLVDRIFLVGKLEKLRSYENLTDAELVDSTDESDASEKGVKLVSSKRADVLVKGLVKTSTLLKAVLNKEWGLRGAGL